MHRLQAVQPAAQIEEALRALDAGHRTVADGQWGLRLETAGAPGGPGWPLDVGLALHAGADLLRLQAEVCGPGLVDPSALLHRNRRLPLVAFTQTLAGVVWIEAWLPVVAVDAVRLDAVLGLLLSAAEDVRAVAYGGGAD